MNASTTVSRVSRAHPVLLLAITSVALTAGASAAEPARTALVLVKGGVLRIEGTSTLHPWHADAKEIDAVFTLKSPTTGTAIDLETLAHTGQLVGFSLSVPVKSLSSGEGGLDDNLRKALNADKYPNILFEMDSLQAPPNGAMAGSAFSSKLSGKLTVAGVARPVDIDVEAKPEAGAWRITGHRTLLMSDYQVKPPVLMMGMLHTGDQIDVKFDLELKPGA